MITTSIPEMIRDAAIEITTFGGYKPSWVPVSEDKKLKGIELNKITVFAQLIKK